MVEELQEELRPQQQQPQQLQLQLQTVRQVGLEIIYVMQKTTWLNVSLMVVIAVNLMLILGGTITAKELT